MPRLFEQGADVDPILSHRVAQGLAGNTTKNSTWATILAWLNANLTIPSPVLPQAEIDIGDWDMNVSAAGAAFILVAHGLDITKIRTIKVMIRDDTGAFQRPIDSISLLSNIQDGGVSSIDATNVNLTVKTGGNFDNINHDALAYNRGWITIEYTN